jgi:type VI secretion system FHA domain protein
MPYLQLKLVSENATDQTSSCRFTHQGGSIGRSNDCDWTLIDTDRYISNKHLAISFQNQNFVLTDVSSNGVFINNAAVPLGKNNEHILKPSDSIDIGKFSIKVEQIESDDNAGYLSDSSAVGADSGLLGLVMGGDAVTSNSNASEQLLDMPETSQYGANRQTDDGLGLNDILSGSANPEFNSSSTSSESSHYNNAPSSEPMPFVPPHEPYTPPEAAQHYVANDASIPEDWELSGIMPAISDYKVPKENNIPDEVASPAIQEPAIPPTTNVDIQNKSFVPETMQKDNIIEDFMPPEDEKPPLTPSINTELPNEPFVPVTMMEDKPQELKAYTSEPIASSPPIEVSNISSDSSNSHNDLDKKQPNFSREGSTLKNNDDVFLNTLYNKLGLPKEYISGIEPDAFADDIVTILLSTTKGLMSLLNSRTVFKQESRLSLTSVQPRSNNPIKFSIDPVDTLEMLLLKKKKGYMSAKDSYDEAVEDIQLHQMAFLSGLQATLVGVLGQLDPESIEAQVNENSRSFMGLNSTTKCWQLYKEKQQVISKSVTENLNGVLSNYFSEAYQAQINSFKNEK